MSSVVQIMLFNHAHEEPAPGEARRIGPGAICLGGSLESVAFTDMVLKMILQYYLCVVRSP